MGFSAKQLQALRRPSMSARSAPVKPMAGSFPISRVGLPSRKPTAYSDLMAGAGRRLKPAASFPVKTAARSWPSISPKCASRCRWRAQPSFARAMVPVKAAGLPLVKSTILLSKLQRPMPANARWQPLADHLALSFIGKAARQDVLTLPLPYSQHQPLQSRHALAFTPTTPRPFHDRRATTAAGNHHQSLITQRATVPATNKSCASWPAPPLAPAQLPEPVPSNQPKSTKAFSPSPNPDGAGTSHICALWRPSPASCADVIPPTRITYALPNRAP